MGFTETNGNIDPISCCSRAQICRAAHRLSLAAWQTHINRLNEADDPIPITYQKLLVQGSPHMPVRALIISTTTMNCRMHPLFRLHQSKTTRLQPFQMNTNYTNCFYERCFKHAAESRKCKFVVSLSQPFSKVTAR